MDARRPLLVIDEGLALMAAILQHVPHMDDLSKPKTALFTSVEELLAIPWVAFWGTDEWSWPFYRFSVDYPRLMAEYDKGAVWQLVGIMSLDDPAQVANLPRWVKPTREPSAPRD